MQLKEQDLLVVLKLASLADDDSTYARIAADLEMSVSQVHAAVRRATRDDTCDAPVNPRSSGETAARQRFPRLESDRIACW